MFFDSFRINMEQGPDQDIRQAKIQKQRATIVILLWGKPFFVLLLIIVLIFTVIFNSMSHKQARGWLAQ